MTGPNAKERVDATPERDPVDREETYPAIRDRRDDDVPMFDAQTEDARTEDARTEDAPTEDTRVEEARVEEARVEEARVEEARTDDTPVEDARTAEEMAEAIQAEEPPAMRTEEDAHPTLDGAPAPLDDSIPALDDDALRERWDRMQMGFVDDPATATEQARALVLEAMDAVRGQVESGSPPNGDTEDLRQRVAEYRRIFVGLTG